MTSVVQKTAVWFADKLLQYRGGDIPALLSAFTAVSTTLLKARQSTQYSCIGSHQYFLNGHVGGRVVSLILLTVFQKKWLPLSTTVQGITEHPFTDAWIQIDNKNPIQVAKSLLNQNSFLIRCCNNGTHNYWDRNVIYIPLWKTNTHDIVVTTYW